jgi:hypothetical protein
VAEGGITVGEGVAVEADGITTAALIPVHPVRNNKSNNNPRLNVT